MGLRLISYNLRSRDISGELGVSYSPRHFSPFILNSRLRVPAPLTPGHKTQSHIFDEDLNSQNTESNGESQTDTDTLSKSNSKEQLPKHSKDKEQSKELIVTPKIGTKNFTPGVPRPPLFTSGNQNQSLITPSIVVPSNISNNDSDVKIVSDVPIPTKNVKSLPSNRQYDLMNSCNVQNRNQTNPPLHYYYYYYIQYLYSAYLIKITLSALHP